MSVWILVVVVIVAVIIGVGIVASKSRRSSTQPPLSSAESEVARGARVGLEKLKCQECGAELEQDDITVREGLTFVSCSYCGSTYQLVEEPQ